MKLPLRIRIAKSLAKIQTTASPKVDPLVLAREILAAGWEGEEAVTAFAVAGAESGFKIQAKNVNRQGLADYGLFQINDIHRPTKEEKYDVTANVRRAKAIYDRRKQWDDDPFSAWFAYKDRFATEKKRQWWEQFIQMGREAIAQVQSEG